jgi:hypothetical protein
MVLWCAEIDAKTPVEKYHASWRPGEEDACRPDMIYVPRRDSKWLRRRGLHDQEHRESSYDTDTDGYVLCAHKFFYASRTAPLNLLKVGEEQENWLRDTLQRSLCISSSCQRRSHRVLNIQHTDLDLRAQLKHLVQKLQGLMESQGKWMEDAAYVHKLCDRHCEGNLRTPGWTTPSMSTLMLQEIRQQPNATGDAVSTCTATSHPASTSTLSSNAGVTKRRRGEGEKHSSVAKLHGCSGDALRLTERVIELVHNIQKGHPRGQTVFVDVGSGYGGMLQSMMQHESVRGKVRIFGVEKETELEDKCPADVRRHVVWSKFQDVGGLIQVLRTHGTVSALVLYAFADWFSEQDKHDLRSWFCERMKECCEHSIECAIAVTHEFCLPNPQAAAEHSFNQRYVTTSMQSGDNVRHDLLPARGGAEWGRVRRSTEQARSETEERCSVLQPGRTLFVIHKQCDA